MSFAHLHTHCEHSLLDGHGRIDNYFAKAARDGQPAIAITDHGNMHHVPAGVKAAAKHGVKHIPGIEIYREPEAGGFTRGKQLASDSSAGDDSQSGKRYFHMTAFAASQEGYTNLCKISTRSWDNFYYKPLVSNELLSQFSKDIIVTTSCLGGVPLQALMRGDEQAALKDIAMLRDIFGDENVLVEVQNHGIPEQLRTNGDLIRIAKDLGLRVVLTNDCHYCEHGDHENHDAMLCMQTKAKLSDENRFRFTGDPGSNAFKLSAEMRSIFPDHPEFCDNTLWVAERCEPITFGEPGVYHMPKFDIPSEFDSEIDYLTHLCYLGAKWRFKDSGGITGVRKERLDYELSVIGTMGYAGYFLILWDLCKFARSEGILVGVGRGSAAGSLVAYCSRITDLDPLKYDLLFERFLNPSRVSMPDIDMDFGPRHRDKLINYTKEKYGAANVGQILTLSTFQSKMAVNDSARILGIGYDIPRKINATLPEPIAGKQAPLSAYLADQPQEGYERFWAGGQDLRTLHRNADEHTKKTLEIAQSIEGLPRHVGIHAAAVVIADKPLEEYLPMELVGKAGAEKKYATQFEMGPVEDLGLLKMDYLGLRNLDVIQDAIDLIKEYRGVTVDLHSIDLEDDKTYDMLCKGWGAGVFQFESASMRDFMRKMQPRSLDDLAAQTSLFRPGPMDMGMHMEFAKRNKGESPITYLHPDAEPLLRSTKGILTYQESVMQIAQVFAGYDLAEADNLRRAMGKKKDSEMKLNEKLFTEGCVKNGYGEELASQWWELIKPFADYAFNRSHAYAYSLTSYWTAWLKANYSAEYMSALLSSVDVNRAGVYIFEASKLGLEVLPPDVNESGVLYAPSSDSNIRFGLSGIRNIGEGPANLIVAERNANGPFTSLSDFAKRVPKKATNVRVVESLIKSGAFDNMHSRGGLLVDNTFQKFLEGGRRDQAFVNAGVISIFDSEPTPETIEVTPYDLGSDVRATFEYEFLGTWISDHPLFATDSKTRKQYADIIADKSSHDISDIVDEEEDASSGSESNKVAPGTKVTVGGLIKSLNPFVAKSSGKPMATLQLADLTGEMKVVVFNRTWLEYESTIRENDIVFMEGKIADDGQDLLCQKIRWVKKSTLASDGQVAAPQGFLVSLSHDPSDAEIHDLQRFIHENPGDKQVYIELPDKKRMKLADNFRLNSSAYTQSRLKTMSFVEELKLC